MYQGGDRSKAVFFAGLFTVTQVFPNLFFCKIFIL